MTITARHRTSWSGPGAVLAGHTIEHEVEARNRAELLYAVRGPDGESRTLVAARRPCTSRSERARVRRLRRRLTELDHAAAIRVHEVTDVRGHPVVITDAYPECTFRDLLEQDAPLAPERVVRMLAPVVQALDVAHADGLVHLTLSSDSLLLLGRQRLQLDTFGIMALAEEPGAMPDTRYASPEQLRGEPPGPAANVYSLGALLMHALTGAPPERGELVSHRVPGLGPEIDRVIARALAEDPSERQRFPSTLLHGAAAALGVSRPEVGPTELVTPVRPRLRVVTDSAPAVVDDPPAAAGRSRSRRVLAVLAAVVAIACGVAAAAMLTPFGAGDTAPAARARPAAAWTRLDDQRAGLRDELAAARTPDGQARAATALAALYGGAAGSDAPRALNAAARDARDAYSGLAAAAEQGDEVAYGQATEGVEQAEARLALAASRH
jgi:serine/threonine-protein kinase